MLTLIINKCISIEEQSNEKEIFLSRYYQTTNDIVNKASQIEPEILAIDSNLMYDDEPMMIIPNKIIIKSSILK
jgi:hypothetical protein